MQELKLLLLEKGDSQKNLVDKTNFNFSQIISFDGGPYGKIGPEGKSGNSGISGPKGSFGPQGKRGNIWTILDSAPLNPSEGDYWMNPANNNEIRVYNSSTGNWDLYSVNINSLDIFREYSPIQTPSGPSPKGGYFISLPYPILTTMVLSDSYLSNGSITANPQYSKFVISTDSQNLNRRILEFTKGDYHGTSFNQETPHFFWSTGPTATEGNYALNFLSPKSLGFDLGGDFSLNSLSGSAIIKSASFSLGYRLDTFINGLYSSNSSTGDLNINVNSGGGSLLFSGKNIYYPVNTGFSILTTTTLDVQTSGTTGSQPSLNLISKNVDLGNLYYKMDEVYPSTRSGSTLFKATNSSNTILEISGKGDFKIDKAVYPVQTRYNPGSIQTGSLISPPLINYRVFTPSISLNGQTSSNSFNTTVGMDFYVDPVNVNPILDLRNGLVLWTPATGGSFGENGGWLNLLEESEYTNFRIHSTYNDSGFRYLAINTSNVKNSVGSGFTPSLVDLGSEASTIEFTIMNLSKTSGGTGGNKRWFKVLYQAYGNDLNSSGPICGELYTNGSTP
jgi:hypothetical protein